MAETPFFPGALVRLAARYLLRRGWQSLLMILGIVLGVAVMVSIDLANASAGRAFQLSTEAVAGKATHQIVSSGAGIPEQDYSDLLRQGLLQNAAPVVSAFGTSPALGKQPFQLLGIDPFVDGEIHNYWSAISLDANQSKALYDFLTQPGAVIISRDTANQNNLQEGQALAVEINGRPGQAHIVAIIDPPDELTRRALEGVLLADIATAQELSGQIGLLSRIDLVIDPDQGINPAALAAHLPQGLVLSPTASSQGSVQEMTHAFQLNLTALSLLALVVGLFLIYNTMTFSVVQRREMFGSLRCLGVTRREIFLLVVVEAFFVGVVGSLLGVGAGILLGRNTVAAVMQTINDLYFTTTIRNLGIPLSSLFKGAGLGILAAVVTSIPPALEAAGVAPRMALLRSGLEKNARRAVWILSGSGLLMLLAGLALFAIPSSSIQVGFAGTMLVVVGIALMAALVFRLLMVGATPLTGWLFGFIGKMAPRNLLNALSRTAIAVSALMVALAVTIGVTLMIDSFRYTVTLWLQQTLQSDVYLTGPSFTENISLVEIDPAVVQQLDQTAGIAQVILTRSANIQSNLGPVILSATNNPRLAWERKFKERIGDPQVVYDALKQGDVILSEPLANRLGLKSGDSLILDSPHGQKHVTVAGVYYDYSSSQGVLMMDMGIYRQAWDDPAVTAIGLVLTPGQNADAMAASLRENLTSSQRLVISPNLVLRNEVMAVFDRTFAVTSALRILATVVALIGILSTLLLLQMEKQREVGILKALGLAKNQLWKLVMLETGLMGLSAGLLAMPTGYILALVLIYVINLRSFGWTLQLSVRPGAFLFALGLAVAAALLIGILPAARLSRMAAAEAIRYE